MSKDINQSKNKLQRALIQMLSEKSMADISVSELVKKAGLNRSTFYAHYQNINDLLNEIIDQEMKNIPIKLDMKKLTEDDFRDEIRYILDHQDVFKVLLKSGRYEEYIMEKLNEEIPFKEEYRYFYLINAFFMSGFQRYLLFSIEYQDDYSLNEMTRIIYHLFKQSSSLIDKYQHS